jgi:hypothetical protein
VALDGGDGGPTAAAAAAAAATAAGGGGAAPAAPAAAAKGGGKNKRRPQTGDSGSEFATGSLMEVRHRDITMTGDSVSEFATGSLMEARHHATSYLALVSRQQLVDVRQHNVWREKKGLVSSQHSDGGSSS